MLIDRFFVFLNDQRLSRNRKADDPMQFDKVIWLAGQIFKVFPQEVTGLKFYTLGCGCIYYQRVLGDGDLDPQVGIYRDADAVPARPVCHLMRFGTIE